MTDPKKLTGQYQCNDTTINFTMHLPPAPTETAVIITHGFSRSQYYHGGFAAKLAEKGVLSVVWDMSWRGAVWKATVNCSSLCGLCKALSEGKLHPDQSSRIQRIALVGFSAGASVTVVAAQGIVGSCLSSQIELSSVLLLDGVPYPGVTWDELPRVNALSLRGDPSAWNKNGVVATALPNVRDIRVFGAAHADFEWPEGYQEGSGGGWWDKWVLGIRSREIEPCDIAHQLMCGFVLEGFGVEGNLFGEMVEVMKREGKIGVQLGGVEEVAKSSSSSSSS